MELSLAPSTMSAELAQRKRKTQHLGRISFASGFSSFRPSVIPASPWSIKGKAGHNTKVTDRLNTPHITSQIAEQRPSSQHPFDLSIRDLGSFPLSPVCNPYYELFSANNMSNSHELDVGIFCPNQYKPFVFFSTPSGPDTQ